MHGDAGDGASKLVGSHRAPSDNGPKRHAAAESELIRADAAVSHAPARELLPHDGFDRTVIRARFVHAAGFRAGYCK